MASKKTKRPTVSARNQSLIATAAGIGFAVAEGFQAAVVLARSIGQGSKLALVEAGMAYRSGYIVRYMMDNAPHYLKRVGNLDQAQRFADGADIYAKAGPETDKPNRRTALEHKACRAADQSWSTAKARAFGKAAAKRRPRQSSAPANPVPVDLVKAAPKLTTKAAVNDYLSTASAALLAFHDKNAKLVTPQLSSAISDFKAAVAKALNL